MQGEITFPQNIYSIKNTLNSVVKTWTLDPSENEYSTTARYKNNYGQTVWIAIEEGKLKFPTRYFFSTKKHAVRALIHALYNRIEYLEKQT